MKNYKNCEGCGRKLQSTNPSKEGYTPKEDSSLCQECFKSLNYGVKENNLTEFKIEDYLELISSEKGEVFLIIDVLNPFRTLIKNINKYVNKDRLTLVVNKIDVLPKAVKHETIIDYIYKIAESKGIEFKNISLVSTLKNTNIDVLYDYIQSLDKKVSIIGYSNVGKSSFIKALFGSKVIKVNNLVSYTIGTTLEPITLELGENDIVDYPGFFMKDNYQNYLDKEQLRKTIPRKEIKVRTYQLDQNQLIDIDGIAYFAVEEQESKLGYQFSFSNDFEIMRHNLDNKDKFINKKFVRKEILPLKNIERQDIVINGIGTITFSNHNQKMSIYLPEEISVDVIESLYN